MKIQIIGKNSSNRIKLLKNVERVLQTKNSKVSCEIEVFEDQKYQKLYHITNTPALVIDDKVISEGKVLNEREIKKLILVHD